MKTKVFIIIAMVAVSLGLIVSAMMENAGDNKDNNQNKIDKELKVEYTSEDNRIVGEFASKTACELLAARKENTCYSPLSLYAMLALTAENADGKTRAELLEGLGVDSISDMEELYAILLEKIEVKEENYNKIMLANSMWIDSDYVEDDYDSVGNDSVKKLASEVRVSDSIDSGEVNKWIKEKTGGQIDGYLPEIDDCDMALVNVLHYKSKWSCLFRKEEKEFNLIDGESIKTEYISSTVADISYRQCEKFTMSNIPLHKGKLVMVMPEENVSLETLMTEENINEIMALAYSENMDKANVNINMPVFECSDKYVEQLEAMLKNMGINHLFENSEWKISEKLDDADALILQNNKIIVDSYGVEASAVTEGVYTVGGNMPIDEELSITYDRPFMYILMNEGVPLFIGTVYNPAQ